MNRKYPTRLRRIEEAITTYHEMVPTGVELPEVLTAGYWVHVHKHIRPGDIFYLCAEDGSFDVVARVVGHANGYLKFRILAEATGEIVEDTRPVGSRFKAHHIGFGSWVVQDTVTGQFDVTQKYDKDGATTEADRMNAPEKAA